jgi:hypothetical protein
VVGIPLCGALLGVPLLVLHTGAARAAHTVSASAEGLTAEAAAPVALPIAGAVAAPQWQLSAATVAGSTLPPPAPAATPVAATRTAAPAPVATVAVVSHQVAQPPPPPPTTTTTVAPAPAVTVHSGNSESGGATWYAQAAPGYCASPDLPFGTVLTVTNQANGASTTCIVNDREASTPGRIVDLSEEGFAQIAPLSEGIVTVTITW